MYRLPRNEIKEYFFLRIIETLDLAYSKFPFTESNLAITLSEAMSTVQMSYDVKPVTWYT